MTGDIYHICNRGVNKQIIFPERKDYTRFVESLYKFNNRDGAIRAETKNFLLDPPPQKKLVDILKWSLMPNHYHLLLHEAIDGGAVEFVKRLGNGFTKYFNIKYRRSGYLFQNKAKIILAENDAHYLYLPYYVELNPLDLIDKSWRAGEIEKISRAENFLNSYRWSSYQDYSGYKNFPAILDKYLFYDIFDTDQKKYEKEMWAMVKGDTKTHRIRQRGTLTGGEGDRWFGWL